MSRVTVVETANVAWFGRGLDGDSMKSLIDEILVGVDRQWGIVGGCVAFLHFMIDFGRLESARRSSAIKGIQISRME